VPMLESSDRLKGRISSLIPSDTRLRLLQWK
jgi:hypothetical protein